ncbi:hypothetical protein GH714_035942 [Hevea brasiliensis]|uniref:Uncharacterized protein n=1 Tax=Hevea brasiliensis TaxID=3981 RepID=A0A6A6L7H5_HEVBR|nr:hypothetical protein GH714_035942 [Hevea brasiliensis]
METNVMIENSMEVPVITAKSMEPRKTITQYSIQELKLTEASIAAILAVTEATDKTICKKMKSESIDAFRLAYRVSSTRGRKNAWINRYRYLKPSLYLKLKNAIEFGLSSKANTSRCRKPPLKQFPYIRYETVVAASATSGCQVLLRNANATMVLGLGFKDQSVSRHFRRNGSQE